MSTHSLCGHARPPGQWRSVAALVLAVFSLPNAIQADPPQSPSPAKEIFGADDRLDVFEETDPFKIALSRSVCALLTKDFLADNKDGTYTILSMPNVIRVEGRAPLPLCPDERFAGQPAAAFCTGFMVGPELIATAGHCAVDSDLSQIRVVFGFDMLDATTPVATVDADQVYTISEEVSARFGWIHDHAILRTDRPISAPGASPLALRRSGRIAHDTRIGTIGHAWGLPKKISFGQHTQVTRNTGIFDFLTNLDASAGNSGSPVFNQETGVVEGIYSFSRESDIAIQGDCFTINRPFGVKPTQGVIRAATFAGIVEAANSGRTKLLPIGCNREVVSRGFDASEVAWGDSLVVLSFGLLLALSLRRRQRIHQVDQITPNNHGRCTRNIDV